MIIYVGPKRCGLKNVQKRFGPGQIGLVWVGYESDSGVTDKNESQIISCDSFMSRRPSSKKTNFLFKFYFLSIVKNVSGFFFTTNIQIENDATLSRSGVGVGKKKTVESTKLLFLKFKLRLNILCEVAARACREDAQPDLSHLPHPISIYT